MTSSTVNILHSVWVPCVKVCGKLRGKLLSSVSVLDFEVPLLRPFEVDPEMKDSREVLNPESYQPLYNSLRMRGQVPVLGFPENFLAEGACSLSRLSPRENSGPSCTVLGMSRGISALGVGDPGMGTCEGSSPSTQSSFKMSPLLARLSLPSPGRPSSSSPPSAEFTFEPLSLVCAPHTDG